MQTLQEWFVARFWAALAVALARPGVADKVEAIIADQIEAAVDAQFAALQQQPTP